MSAKQELVEAVYAMLASLTVVKDRGRLDEPIGVRAGDFNRLLAATRAAFPHAGLTWPPTLTGDDVLAKLVARLSILKARIDASLLAVRAAGAAATTNGRRTRRAGAAVGSDLDLARVRTGDGACLIDGDERIVLWNAAAEAMLGWAADDAIGRPCAEVLVAVDGRGRAVAGGPASVAGRVRQGRTQRHFRVRARTKSGRAHAFDVTVVGFPRDDGDLAATLFLFRPAPPPARRRPPGGERPAPSERAAAPGEAGRLTRRETELLDIIASGAGTRAIADRLMVSRATVRNHVQNIFAKLGVHSRLAAVAYATRHGLLRGAVGAAPRERRT